MQSDRQKRQARRRGDRRHDVKTEDSGRRGYHLIIDFEFDFNASAVFPRYVLPRASVVRNESGEEEEEEHERGKQTRKQTLIFRFALSFTSIRLSRDNRTTRASRPMDHGRVTQ